MASKKQKWISLALALALLAVFGGSLVWDRQARPQPDASMAGWERYTIYWFDVFDTVTRVVGYAPSQQEWTSQMEALHQDLVAYHQLYDIYHSYPGLTSLRDVNETAAQGPVQVDRRTLELLRAAKQAYTLTDGQLNIGLGGVLALWHDYRQAGIEDPAGAALPPREELLAAGEHTDLASGLVLDEKESTVYFADPQLQLDVGSLGKGWAVEQASQAAEARGAKSLFISVGGNLRAVGHRPDGSPWVGGVQNPWSLEEVLCSVEVRDGESLVTSGDYLRYYTVDGQNYCHLIDPDTLYPATLYSGVSVLCADSGLADCLSTGLFCMELEQGRALVDGMDGVEACWQLPDGSVVYSGGFEARLTAS